MSAQNNQLHRSQLGVAEKVHGLRFVPSFRIPLYSALFLAVVQMLILSSAAAQDPSQSGADQSATIRGVVLSTVDNKPIPGAHVLLGQNDRAMYTDDQGQFAFSGLPVGSTSVSTEKPGFLCFLKLSRQQPKCREYVDLQTSNIQLTLTMVPQAAVTGRIVDQTGRPIEKLFLCLMERKVQNGMYAWVNVFETFQQTNAEGAFRIADVEPGTYLLHTSIKPDPAHSGHGYAVTYYPGTSSQEDAMRIVVHAGDELKLDLSVTDQQFQPVSVYYWQHKWEEGSGDWGVLPDTDSSDWNYYRNERYTFEEDIDVRQHLIHFFAPAGEYTVRFSSYPPNDPVNGKLLPWPDGTKERYVGTAAITVKNQPVILTEVPSQHLIDIRLHVRSELAQQMGKRKAVVRPCYEPSSAHGANFTLTEQLTHGGSERDWRANCGPSNFEFKGNYPGLYTLQASAFSGAYIASLTCGNTNLLREPLVLRPGVPACSVEARIRDDFSSLSVGLTAQAAAQLAAAGIAVTGLALIPMENSLDIPYSAELELASLPEKLAIPPGTYLAFLFDGRPIAWRDPDERKRLMSLGTVVTLSPGESKTISLDWRPELNDPKVGPVNVDLGRALP
jgi:hypothetical protein